MRALTLGLIRDILQFDRHAVEPFVQDTNGSVEPGRLGEHLSQVGQWSQRTFIAIDALFDRRQRTDQFSRIVRARERLFQSGLLVRHQLCDFQFLQLEPQIVQFTL